MQARHAQNSGTNTIGRQVTPAATPKNSAPKSSNKTASEAAPSTSKAKAVEFVCSQSGKNVGLAGSFNNWDPTRNPMKKDGDKWKTSVNLAPGRYEYKFVVDGQWISDATCKECVTNDFGSENSVRTV